MRTPQIVGLQIDRVHEHQQTGRLWQRDTSIDETRTFSLCVNYTVCARENETDRDKYRYRYGYKHIDS